MAMRDRTRTGYRKAGIVYILSNPAMPGLLKIGRTSRSMAVRLREINSATGVPLPYRIEGVIEARDPAMAEKATHDALSAYRVNGRREFFRVPLPTAMTAAKASAKTSGGRFRRGKRHARLPTLLSGLLVAASGAPCVALAHPMLPLPWIGACLIALATGKPRPIVELMDAIRFRPVAAAAIACVGGAAAYLIGWLDGIPRHLTAFLG